MSKSLYSKLLIGLSLIGISLACSLLPFTQILSPATETPTPLRIARPTRTETTIPTNLPPLDASNLTPSATPIFIFPTSTPKFAPFCQPSAANVSTPTPFQCHLPVAEQSSLYCADKVPYNLVVINAGSTYEVLNEEVTCTEAGEKDGRQLLTCTGPMAFSFDLRVCDPACAIPTFQARTSNCPQEYSFNETLNCCEQTPQPIDQNCVTLKLQVKTCIVACNEFDTEKTCDKNAHACVWDALNGVCLLKR